MTRRTAAWLKISGGIMTGIVLSATLLLVFAPDQFVTFLMMPDGPPMTEEDIITVAGDTTEQELSKAFVQLFRHDFSFDTVHAPSDALLSDTSYIPDVDPLSEVRGRRISIAFCGVDSRMNERVEHADANHVVTILLDSGIVQITSIPRDTPCEAGFREARYNILTNLRARRGRDAWLKEMASIAGLDTIEYYVDLGFSQALGLLSLAGYGNDAGSALRVLRSRQIFSTGDFQRSFNQGQFIRQMLLNQFDKLDGISGDLLMRAGLMMVETNITLDDLHTIVEDLRSVGFPRNPESVSVRIKPTYYAKMAVFNFQDSLVLGSLLNKIDGKARRMGLPERNTDSLETVLENRLQELLEQAAGDSVRRPVRVVALLRRPFQQRIWWQLSSPERRSRIRSGLGRLLADAYTRLKKKSEAEEVYRILKFENNTFPVASAAAAPNRNEGGKAEQPPTARQTAARGSVSTP